MSNGCGNTGDGDDFALKLRKLRENPSKGLDNLRDEFSEFSESFTKRNYQYIALVVAMYYKIRTSAALKQDILDGL